MKIARPLSDFIPYPSSFILSRPRFRFRPLCDNILVYPYLFFGRRFQERESRT